MYKFMKLHAASEREIKRVALGSLVCLAAMWAAFYLLAAVGIGRFDRGVFLGGLLGTLVAVLNFTALCLTIQSAAQTQDEKRRQAKLQLSYNGRLILQGAWVVAAYLMPWVNVVAGAVPLLFPSITVFFLKRW